jgi:hypothetical protein
MNEMLYREMHRHVGGDMNHEATYEETMVTLEKLGFMRHEGRFEGMSSGWYQNSIGDLYHYDGVIWDNVPNEQIKSLEYLGG